MSFHKLAGNSESRILLANLHSTINAGLVPDAIRNDALRGLHTALSGLSARPRHNTILRVFGSFLHAIGGADYKILANQRPDERCRVALVVDYGKVRAILTHMQRRIRQAQPADVTIIQQALAPGADQATIVAAVALINRYRDGLKELTISNVNLLIWGAPLDALDAVLADPALAADQRANRLRDALGLVHLDSGPTEPERHLFIFRSDATLAGIRALPTHFAIARPTTFDGFDNRRFCQRDLSGRRFGWGNTIDIAAGACAPGQPEVVITPLSIAYFTCAYLGELSGSHFASDDEYVAMLAPTPPGFAAMADTLDAMATAP